MTRCPHLDDIYSRMAEEISAAFRRRIGEEFARGAVARRMVELIGTKQLEYGTNPSAPVVSGGTPGEPTAATGLTEKGRSVAPSEQEVSPAARARGAIREGGSDESSMDSESLPRAGTVRADRIPTGAADAAGADGVRVRIGDGSRGDGFRHLKEEEVSQ